MNLMFLIDTLGGGGAERACLNIASAFAHDHRVTVVTIFDEPAADYYADHRINMEQLRMTIGGSLPSKVKAYARAFKELTNLKKKHKIDICISFLETANFFNVITRLGEKNVISIRNFYSLSINNERKTIRKIKAIIAGKLADKVVCVSEAIRNDMIKNFRTDPGKTCTIYNYPSGYTGGWTKEKADILSDIQHRSGSGFANFLSVGRLSYQKGYWHLIRAFKKVREVIPAAQLIILGQGEMESFLRRVAALNHLEDCVFLLGFDPGIGAYLRKADVYVCSSLYEGFSNAMLEAMEAGLPVISADCFSGPRETLAPGTDYLNQTKSAEMAGYGILVPVLSENRNLTDEPLEYSEEILADAMIRLASDTELRKKYAERAALRVKYFSRERIIGQWKTLINDLYRSAKASDKYFHRSAEHSKPAGQ